MSKAFTREDDDAPEMPVRRAAVAQDPDARNPITPAGAQRLREELEKLVEIERPRLAAEGSAVRRELQAVDERILSLQQSLRTAVVVPPPDPPDAVVRFGATVTVRDARGETWPCRIVGIDEAAPERDWISVRSPLAMALLNARKGTQVRVQLPAGAQELEIVDVKYE
jgi:transcription elongation factor GreB